MDGKKQFIFYIFSADNETVYSGSRYDLRGKERLKAKEKRRQNCHYDSDVFCSHSFLF